MRKYWQMRAEATDRAEILLYEQIGEGVFTEGIGAKRFAKELKALGDIKHITLRINSAGGSVFEGLAIYNQLQAHRAEVTVHIDGIAASIASLIAMAGDTVIMPENAMMMVHDPFGMVVGPSKDMRKMADALDKAKTGLISAYRDKTGMSDEDLADLMSEETWMTALEAVAWGFADEVLEPVKMAANFDLSMFRNPPHHLKNLSDKGVTTMPDKGTLTPAEKFNTEAERQRVGEIWAIAEKFNAWPLGKKAVEEKWEVEKFKNEVLQKRDSHRSQPLDLNLDLNDAFTLGMSARDAERYSIVSALCAQMTNDWSGAGLEREASISIQNQLGRKPQGIFVPMDVLSVQNALTKGTPAAGGRLVGIQHMGGAFIDLLRSRTQVFNLGAYLMSGLQGDLNIPKQDGASTAYWVAEAGDVTLSQPTFDQVAMSPKTVGARTQYTRKLLLQSSPDIEFLVRADLAAVLGIEVDRAAINGSGASNQPTGILNTTGIGDVAIGENGGAPTWDTIVDLETALANSNADIGNMGYLTNSTMRGKLKKTPKVANQAIYVWGDTDKPLNGYKALASNNVPSTLTKGSSEDCSAIIYGNFADLLIGQWGGLDILLDPYTLAASGGMQIVVFMDIDIAVRNAVSFAACLDARDV